MLLGRIRGPNDFLAGGAGMGSSRTGLDLEDTSRTKFCGLGLEDLWPRPEVFEAKATKF